MGNFGQSQSMTQRKKKAKHNNKQLIQRLFGAIVVVVTFHIISLTHLSQKGAFNLVKEYTYGDDPDSISLQLPRPPDFQELLTGDVRGGDPTQFRRIHLVISHCLESLDYVSEFIRGYDIHETTIISKCGAEVYHAPENASIVRLPNVGRCDHSYAWWMSRHVSNLEDDDAVLFIKASDEIHQAAEPRNFTRMLSIASVRGFGCWLKLNRGGMSAYHDTKALSEFRQMSYQRKARDGQQGFASNYKNIDDWWKSMRVTLPTPVTPVCYGGNFVVRATQIKKKGAAVWSRIEKSLSREDNIEEGHFAERSWAGLLSYPLSKENVTALRMHTGVFVKMGINGKPYGGVLADKQRLAMIDDLEEIWKGDAEGGTHHPFRRLHLVISHCVSDLQWARYFTKRYKFHNITLISKCNTTDFWKPQNCKIITMPNIGRHEHSYAWWMSQYSDTIDDEDGVVFIKDDEEPRYDLVKKRKLTDIVRIAGENGFGCWLSLREGMSAYHDTKFLMSYKLEMPGATRRQRKKARQFSEWLRDVGIVLPNPVTPVCYGGMFVAKGSQIKRRGATFWDTIRASFHDGYDIRIAHFLERSWAGILSFVPSAEDLMKLQDRSKVYFRMSIRGRPFHGVLVNKNL